MRLIFLLFIYTLLIACGSIEESQTLRTEAVKLGGSYIAGVGDTVIEVIKEESMPNIAGKADIWGRTRSTGTVVLVYAGMRDGDALFFRRDIDIKSDKTTMNSSGFMVNQSSSSTYSGTVGGSRFSGTSTTTSMPIYLPPNTPQDQITDIRDMSISVAIGDEDGILIEGQLITVLSATDAQVRFEITKLEAADVN
jgi:hypothetical protein